MTVSAQASWEMSERADNMIEWLASFGQTRRGGVTRLLYSPAWCAAQRALQEKMEQFGLTASFDDVGNLFGRLEGTEKQSPVILTGSHLDTVVEGGKYDGAYGIIASLLAVQYLRKHYGRPKKTIEVVSLCEEEGSRFPLAFWGSGSITGKYSFDDVAALKDSNGIPFMEAMQESGFGLGSHRMPKREDLACFLELHIEQGAVLEHTKKSIGVVSHIVGQRRFHIQIIGESNHAGTTPMHFRRDAMSTAAELISYITEKARATDPQLVATIGKITAKPNVPNVIASEVTFSLDIRHHSQALLDAFYEQIQDFFTVVTARTNTSITSTPWLQVAPVPMDEVLTARFRDVTKGKDIPYENMISGAGHDAQVFGTFCPTALLFVPSHKGISHSPKEFTDVRDLENGISILTEVLYKLAY